MFSCSNPYMYTCSGLKIPDKYNYMYTYYVQAEQINKILHCYTTPDYVITDATGCIGGNTKLFCRDYKYVNVVEIDYDTSGILLTNMKSNLNKIVYRCDYNFIKHTLLQDLVFFDPPWGGKEYKKSSSVNLYLSGINVLEIIDSIYNNCSVVCLKAPVNFNIIESKFWNQRVFPIYKFSRVIFNIIIYKKDAFGGTHQESEEGNEAKMAEKHFTEKGLGRSV